MKSKNTALLVAGLLVVGVLVYGIFLRKPANVNLFASPDTAIITLDNTTQVKPGKLYVKPGRHTLVAKFAGFYDKTITFTSTSKLATVNVLMDPSSQAGYDWLAKHPANANLRQQIGGSNYNQGATSLLKNFPIVAKLPYDGPGGEYEISYGDLSTQNGKQVLEIDITFYTQAGQQTALQWLQSQGYVMSKFNVVYVDKTFEPPVTNNPYTN